MTVERPEVVAERGLVATLLDHLDKFAASRRASDPSVGASAWEALTPEIRAMIGRHGASPRIGVGTE